MITTGRLSRVIESQIKKRSFFSTIGGVQKNMVLIDDDASYKRQWGRGAYGERWDDDDVQENIVQKKPNNE